MTLILVIICGAFLAVAGYAIDAAATCLGSITAWRYLAPVGPRPAWRSGNRLHSYSFALVLLWLLYLLKGALERPVSAVVGGHLPLRSPTWADVLHTGAPLLLDAAVSAGATYVVVAFYLDLKAKLLLRMVSGRGEVFEVHITSLFLLAAAAAVHMWLGTDNYVVSLSMLVLTSYTLYRLALLWMRRLARAGQHALDRADGVVRPAPTIGVLPWFAVGLLNAIVATLAWWTDGLSKLLGGVVPIKAAATTFDIVSARMSDYGETTTVIYRHRD